MKIRMYHTSIGFGYLTDETSPNPVFESDDGKTYKSSDNFPLYNCNVGYLHQVEEVVYTEEELKIVDDYIITTYVHYQGHEHDGTRWRFGSTWVNSYQLTEIERINGEKMIRNI